MSASSVKLAICSAEVIARPSEPSRRVDSVLQVLRAGKRRLHIGSPILCAVVLWVLCCGGNRKGKKNCKKAETNTHGNPPRSDNAITIPRQGAQFHLQRSAKQNGPRFREPLVPSPQFRLLDFLTARLLSGWRSVVQVRGLLIGHAQILVRIHRHIVHPHFVVQMRPGRAS